MLAGYAGRQPFCFETAIVSRRLRAPTFCIAHDK
jgi:hypothetical protein